MSNSGKDIEMYNTYSRIGSDHRALRAKVKTSLRTCKAHNGNHSTTGLLSEPREPATNILSHCEKQIRGTVWRHAMRDREMWKTYPEQQRGNRKAYPEKE